MKRKADEELASERMAPPLNQDQADFTETTETTMDVHQAESASIDEAETHKGSTEPSVVHTSTPLTTAHSTTASRRFPSDLKTIPCSWPQCNKTFNRPARLTAHLRSHTNDRPFQCSDCSKSYMEEKHLRQHIKGSHTQERHYVCGNCSKAFLTATRLRRHAAVHQGQDRFRCQGYDPACSRTFRKHQTLQRHIRVDHLDQPAFVCNHALANTPAPVSGSTVGSSGGRTSSASCGAVFESAGALRRHVEYEHSTPKYWCDECAQSLKAAAGAEDGVAESRSLALAPRRVGFATRALLEAHMRREHLSCLFCDVRCVGGPAELHRHMEMYHSGKSVTDRKTIVCPHVGCGKAFTRRPNLNVHIRATHEGLRFVCGDATAVDSTALTAPPSELLADRDLAGWDARTQGCGRGFTSKMKLEEHIRYVHLQQPRPLPYTSALMVVNAPADMAAASSVALAAGENDSALNVPSISPPSHQAADLLNKLTGAKRTLACPAMGCKARFVRYHDLSIHQQNLQHYASKDAAKEPVQQEGKPSLSSGDHDLFGDATEARLPFLHGGDANLESFWFGGVDDADNSELIGHDGGLFNPYDDMDAEEWQEDEAEMRNLIDSDLGYANGGDGNIDPELFA